MLSFLHPSTVDRDKVVKDDKRHGSDTQAVREVLKCSIRDHSVNVLAAVGAVRWRECFATEVACGPIVNKLWRLAQGTV
jgi:hypothetical protein